MVNQEKEEILEKLRKLHQKNPSIVEELKARDSNSTTISESTIRRHLDPKYQGGVEKRILEKYKKILHKYENDSEKRRRIYYLLSLYQNQTNELIEEHEKQYVGEYMSFRYVKNEKKLKNILITKLQIKKSEMLVNNEIFNFFEFTHEENKPNNKGELIKHNGIILFDTTGQTELVTFISISKSNVIRQIICQPKQLVDDEENVGFGFYGILSTTSFFSGIPMSMKNLLIKKDKHIQSCYEYDTVTENDVEKYIIDHIGNSSEKSKVLILSKK